MTGLKPQLAALFDYNSLQRSEAEEIMLQIGEGKFNEAELAAFISVFLMRSVTIDELQGFRDALLQMAMPANLQTNELVDIVGTGGDGKDTFNISTLSCFIVAGAGHKVAKHGNYGSSSISGASNLMEFLGYKFSTDSDKLNAELDRSNLCFLHAPLFHPSLKVVGSLRKNLGFRTFFNMLGPLVNPADPAFQLIGVYNLEMARIYKYMLQQQDRNFCIIHSLDGYDEISLTGDTRVITNKTERVYSAQQLGKRTVSPIDIFGGNSVEASAKIFTDILQGNGSWAQNAVVLANAAMALQLTGQYDNYEACYQKAVESLETGAAFKTMQKLIN